MWDKNMQQPNKDQGRVETHSQAYFFLLDGCQVVCSLSWFAPNGQFNNCIQRWLLAMDAWKCAMCVPAYMTDISSQLNTFMLFLNVKSLSYFHIHDVNT